MAGDDSTADALGRLRAAHAAILARLSLLDQLTEAAAHQIYCAESADRAVIASVDGNGRLLDLVVQPGAFRRSHPETVGPEIVGAVAGARAVAAREKARQVRLAFAATGR